MGGVIRKKRIAIKPRKPFERERLVSELKLVGDYGLRNKKELWTIATYAKQDKNQAKNLLITTNKEQFMTEGRALLDRLSKNGMITGVDFNDEDKIRELLKEVLNFELANYLERRAQTLVHKMGLAQTIHKARCLITQNQITIKGRVINKPGMMIRSENEGYIEINPNSATHKAKKGRYAKKHGNKEE
ncbi:RS9 [Hepatospora eriocheir]|uniref:RS9 n=1 Tax=Hepatospora eriocheir TaxID=1081669 RepID=A0A1X0QIE6_9MICR|nr:RS9 [Hepatospora eriocheir]ORD99523.1 RS9 [Hepatospora eriocheir]